MDLNLGDTKLIISEAKKQGLTLFELAYVLATAYHETAHTMKPVREYGGEAYLKSKKYYPYVGMGYVQLTWDYNYKKAGLKLGVDFLKNPKLLLKPEYAVPILIIGMKEGWFTGKSLKDYIDSIDESDKEDLREFSNARRIINGTDKQVEIGQIALKYEELLKQFGYNKFEQALKPIEKPVQNDSKEDVPVVIPKKKTLLDLILELIKALFK